MSGAVAPISPAKFAKAVGEMVVGTLRPRKPDERLIRSIIDAGFPSGSRTVRVRTLPQTPRRVPALGVIEGATKHPRIEIAVTSFVVEHPEATFVIDPGLCADADQRAISELSRVLRPMVSVPKEATPTAIALAETKVDFAFATHAHWDHVCGLLDMGDLPLTIHAPERDWMMDGPVAPSGGVRASLDRELRTFDLDGPPISTFTASHDLFGDGSVVIVDLAGHTPGQVGVLLHTNEGRVLIGGDAAWHYDQVETLRQKPGIPGCLVDENRGAAFKTLHRLHLARHQLRVVPVHDHTAATHLSR